MKAYKIELLVIAFENYSGQDIKEIIENNKYISPQVQTIQCVDIGEWSEDHPLNNRKTSQAEYIRLFYS